MCETYLKTIWCNKVSLKARNLILIFINSCYLKEKKDEMFEKL